MIDTIQHATVRFTRCFPPLIKTVELGKEYGIHLVSNVSWWLTIPTTKGTSFMFMWQCTPGTGLHLHTPAMLPRAPHVQAWTLREACKCKIHQILICACVHLICLWSKVRHYRKFATIISLMECPVDQTFVAHFSFSSLCPHFTSKPCVCCA